MTKKEIGTHILESLKNSPGDWRISSHTAQLRDLEMWIANRPYGDLTINGTRIGTWWQRRKIRELIDEIAIRRALNDIPPLESRGFICAPTGREVPDSRFRGTNIQPNQDMRRANAEKQQPTKEPGGEREQKETEQ
jgi:hypothetical protein